MLCKLAENASAVSIFDPLNLHGLESAATDNLIDSAHHGDSCAILKLFDNGSGLCKETNQVQVIGLLHA